MGYYSNVMIILTEKEYYELYGQIVNFVCSNGYEEKYNEHFIKLGFNCIKWYDDENIDIIENFIHNAQEVSYARFGEDDTDYEEYYNSVLGDMPRISLKRDFEIID